MNYNKSLLVFILGLIVFSILASCGKQSAPDTNFGLLIHGGAGTISRDRLSPELEQNYRAKLEEALRIGYDVLAAGGTSLDAVEAAIVILEDSPLFNAGKGAVFASNGSNELDASIMAGKTLRAGAVSGVKQIKNPIKAARLVMEKSPHVLLYGEGAETYTRRHGLEFVDQSYFYTERRWQSLQKARAKEQQTEPEKHGTVGVVALDQHGNLAAGTSTGGLTNKRFGRIGDSPIIGAGNYADNRTCAVSATGTGEYFMRTVCAYAISARMEFGGVSLQTAAEDVIHNEIGRLGGTGGVIGIDKSGNIAMVFNTPGMYRGYMMSDGQSVIKIFAD